MKPEHKDHYASGLDCAARYLGQQLSQGGIAAAPQVVEALQGMLEAHAALSECPSDHGVAAFTTKK